MEAPRQLPSLTLPILAIANHSDSQFDLALQESGTQKFLLGGALRPTVGDGVAPSPHHGGELTSLPSGYQHNSVPRPGPNPQVKVPQQERAQQEHPEMRKWPGL